MDISKLLEELELADEGATDRNGNTELHLTVQNKTFTQQEMIDSLQILLDKGINPNIKNNCNETVLQLAVAYRLKEVVNFLISRKIKMDSVAHFFIEYEYKRFLKLTTQENKSDELTSEKQKIENESASYLEWLISKGFDFDFKIGEKQSSLHVAINHNMQHLLPVLFKHTKNIHSTAGRNTTLLHSFLDNNSRYGVNMIAGNWYSNRYAADIVKILLDRGVSPDAEDYDQSMPAETAFRNKADFKVMEILLEQTTKFSHQRFGNTLLRMVMESFIFSDKSESEYHLKILRAVIAKGANIDELHRRGEFGENCLCSAVIQQNMSAIEFLQENGADFSVITTDNQNLLHWLAQSPANVKTDDETQIRIFNLLVSKGCMINVKDTIGNTPLHEAVYYDNVVMIRMLIEHGAEVNCKTDDGDTPILIAAVVQKNPKAVKLLRDNGADLNVTTKDGETLIRYILKSSKYKEIDEEDEVDLVDLMLTEDCHINEKDETGTSLIHLAVINTDVAVIRLLIERGADVNCRDYQGETPLHLAIYQSSAMAVARLLLEHGANVNAKDLQGQTALHKTAIMQPSSNRSIDMISLLLEYGTDVNAQDVNGMTALYYACLHDNVEFEKQKRIWLDNYLTCRGDDYDQDMYAADRFFQEVHKDANITVILLTMHSNKLKAANLPWDRQIDGWLGFFGIFDDYEKDREQYCKDCSTEVEKLKQTFIDNRVSLYSFLHMNPSSRCAYLNNEELQKLVQFPLELENKFPEYFVLILANYREANTRKLLLESAKRIWQEFTKIDLPDLCLECIFSFLSNSELFYMIEKEKMVVVRSNIFCY